MCVTIAGLGTTSLPTAWSTFVTGALQHIVRVLERLHGRPVDPNWRARDPRLLLDSQPVTLLDYSRRRSASLPSRVGSFGSWPATVCS